MSTIPSHREVKWCKKLLLFVPLVLVAGCNWGGPQTLPAQVVGIWKTDDPRYYGRFLKLDSDQVIFGLGGVAPNKIEHIEKVKMAPTEKATEYTIKLKADDGTSDAIALRFTPENGGELGIKNQPKVVWTRKSFPDTALPGKILQGKAPPRDGAAKEHKTIYKIDCLLPNSCRSY
jgi:hypothetical protein